MKYLTTIFFVFGAIILPAQELLNLNTTHHCIYSGALEEELYSFEPNASVPAMVDKILRATGTPQNFTLIETNVENVVAVLDGEKRYILYSQDFFIQTKDKVVAYGLLAHEIGHHAARHTFDDTFREKEELEADLFMGYALCKTPDIQFNAALSLPDRIELSYEIPKPNRRTAIEAGWRRADAHLRGKDNLAYYENEHNNPTLPIPRFPWPPPMADQKRTLATQLLTKSHCRTLDDVDLRLRHALEGRGYKQLSYFQTPGGFAVVTQLEQIKPDRSSESGKARWTDYPAQDDFNGLWKYLQALDFPQKGNYRLFVFIVTDTAYTLSKTRVTKEEAVRWLSLGLNVLPPEVGKTRISDHHRLDALVYEFGASQDSDNIVPKRLSAKDTDQHLTQSGLKGLLREEELLKE